MRPALALLIAVWPWAAAAQDDPGALARAAGAALAEASQQLDAAESARDRVRALTKTVQAYEDGLAAMRSGLRRATIREEELRRRLAARDAEIAALLAALQTMSPDRTPTAFLHPDGPVGTARAGMLLAEVTPALNQRAAQLRSDLTDVQDLRLLQQDAARQVEQGLAEVQQARTALNQAMAERVDLPKRFTEDPVRTAVLIASSETLDAFSSGLSKIAVDERDWAPPALEDRIGELPLPVRGVVLRKVGEADAAGITRPGILLATRAGALVTAPTAATLRYVGPLLDFGNVVILEPRPGTLFVLAGLGVTYGTTGDIVAEGAPLGLMGGLPGTAAENGLSTGGEGGGAARTETLYIEIRQDNATRDPLDWFAADKDG